jgi:hypothetical protein
VEKIFASLGGRFARDDMPWRKVFQALANGFSTGYQGMTPALAKIFPRATKA